MSNKFRKWWSLCCDAAFNTRKNHTYVISQHCDIQYLRQHLASYYNIDVAQPSYGFQSFKAVYKWTQRAIILPCSPCTFLSIYIYFLMSNESDLLNVVRDIASVFSQRRDMTSSSCSQHGCVLKTMLSHYNVFYRVSLCVTKISWLAWRTTVFKAHLVRQEQM